MKPRKKNDALQFAVCINNDEYPASLELHKIYRVDALRAHYGNQPIGGIRKRERQSKK